MIASLALLHRRLTAALPLAGTRQLADGPTAGELLLEGQFANELEPLMGDLYSFPIRRGLARRTADGREAIAAWVLALYRDNPDETAALAALLAGYARRGFNLGGQMALSGLGASGVFALQNEGILDALSGRAEGLVDPDGRVSLVRTTANDLGRQVSAGHDEGLKADDIIAGLSSYILLRSLGRSAVIAETETVWSHRRGMAETFDRNGIRKLVYRTAPGACPQCQPNDGAEFPAEAIPAGLRPPLHSGCRCYHQPVTAGWTLPEVVWYGD